MYRPINKSFSRTRKYAMSLFVLFALFGASPAFAKDPCRAAICMWGLLNGQTAECGGDIADYFNILEFRKKHKIDWNKTASSRLNFMNSCPSADRGKTKEVNDKYGKALGG